MIEGVCVGWNEGYGHVLGDDGVEYFAAGRSIEGDGYCSLVEGMRVRFEPSDDDERGPVAERVRLIGYSTSGAGPA